MIDHGVLGGGRQFGPGDGRAVVRLEDALGQ